MELYGEVVKHKSWGRGEIVKFVNNYITVLFDNNNEEKKFIYPDAFEKFLELENKSLIKEIEKDKNIIDEKKAEIKRINEERLKAAIEAKEKDLRVKNNTTVKSSDKNNIAFKCNYCDGGKNKEIVGYKGVCSDEIIK